MASKKKDGNSDGIAEGGDMIPQLVARVSESDAEEAESLGKSAEMAVAAVNNELARLHALVVTTEKEVGWRTNTAIAFKGVTLLGGLGVLTGKVPGLDQLIGALIVVVAGADLLMGNYQRLRSRLASVDATQELVDAVEDATSISITVMRLAGQKPPRGGPMAALRIWSDFMQDLQVKLAQGHRAVRSAHRKLEIDLVKRLDLSQATKNGDPEAPRTRVQVDPTMKASTPTEERNDTQPDENQSGGKRKKKG